MAGASLGVGVETSVDHPSGSARGSRCSRVRRVWPLLAVLGGLILIPVGGAAANLQKEIEQQLLERIIRYTEWPAESAAVASSDAFVIAVLGGAEMYRSLDLHLSHQVVNNSVVSIQPLAHIEELDLDRCHVLFIGREHARALDEILLVVQDHPILTVADTYGFCQRGVVLNFSYEGSRLVFDINAEAARRARLHFSARLVAMARRVFGETGESETDGLILILPNDASWEAALDAYRRGEIAAAQDYFQSLSPSHPQYAAARYMLGRCQLRSGQTAAGIRNLEIAADQEPGNSEYILALARVLLSAERPGEAYEVLSDAISWILGDPTLDESEQERALDLLASAATHSGKEEEAVSLLRQATSGELEARVYAALGSLLRGLERHAEAFEAYARAYQIDSQHSDWAERAVTSAILGARTLPEEEKVHLCRRAAELAEIVMAKTRKLEELLVVAELWIGARGWERAMSWLERAQALRPLDARVAYDFAVVLSQLGRYSAAAGELDRAAAQDPDPQLAAAIHTLRVMLFTAQGKQDQAAAAYDSLGDAMVAMNQGKSLSPKSSNASGSSVRSRSVPAGAGVTGVPRSAAQASMASVPSPAAVAPTRTLAGPVIFKDYGKNRSISTKEDNLSTFGLEVDTSSYSVARSYLRSGRLPPPASVRVEEWLNSFDYGDPAPAGDDDFALLGEGASSPFSDDPDTWLLRFGVKARLVPPEERPPAMLVLLVDISGSMAMDNRLRLVKDALRILVDSLRPDDMVGLVVYGTKGQVLTPPSTDHGTVLGYLEALRPGGSTNAEEGLTLAYQLATEHLLANAINRVVLCSDGVANVGRTSSGGILERIERSVELGIELTAVGFGMGNFNDVLLEQLADKGNGRYAYVDCIEEAERLFAHGGTLFTIAHDAKAQVELDPAVVSTYRLLGYENRDIADERFRDDDVDAGEIGAGHAVSALYEVTTTKGSLTAASVLATLHLRYRPQGNDYTIEVEHTLSGADIAPSPLTASPSMQLASLVAELADILKVDMPSDTTLQKAALEEMVRRLDLLLDRSERLPKELEKNDRVQELLELINTARSIAAG